MQDQSLQKLSKGRFQLPPDMQGIKNFLNNVRNIRNPQAMIMNELQKNPNYSEAMKLIQDSNGDAMKAFYKLANERGVDPEEVLNQLR